MSEPHIYFERSDGTRVDMTAIADREPPGRSHCPTCGADVRVAGGPEGTQHYEPVAETQINHLVGLLKEIEALKAFPMLPRPTQDRIRSAIGTRGVKIGR